MSSSKKGWALMLAAVAFLLGSVLLLGCQPAQPVPLGTPQAAEKGAAVPQPTPKAGETPPQKPAAAATTTKPAEKPVRGGTLRVVDTSDYPGLDPLPSTGRNPIVSYYETLIKPDKDGNLTKEGLARDWTVGSDGKSITFKLREGVKFHDGTDFDAAAVKFNVDRFRDPALRSPHAIYYDSVTSLEVLDSLTVRFNLSRPDVLILPRQAGPAGNAGGAMVSPAAVKKYGVDFNRTAVGTGPFQFVEWTSGDHLTVKRFDGYWKKDKDGNQLPYLDQVVYRIITDPTTAVAALRTGQIDLFGGSSGLPANLMPVVKSDPNLTYTESPALVSGTAMNTKRAPFDNKALRQAVALALDRQGMADVTGAIPVTSMFHPIEKAYDDGKSGVFPARDVAKAKAKMAEAGYAAGGLKVKYTSGNSPDEVLVAQILKANLAEIGIEVEIEVLAAAAKDTKVRTSPWDYQMASASTGIVVGDPGHVFGWYWHSRSAFNIYGPYSNPRFDELLDKATATYDQKARAALYNEAAKELVEDTPFVPTRVPPRFTGLNKKVRNFFTHAFWYDHVREVWLAP